MSRLFEIHAPDGRIFRNRFDSVADAKAQLIPGYDLIGEIVTPRDDNTGGFSVPLQPDPAPGQPEQSPTLMGHLLRADGDELMAFLAANGIAPAAERPAKVAPAAKTAPPAKDTAPASAPAPAGAAEDGAEKA